MRFEVKERKFLKLEGGDALAVEFHGFVGMRYGDALVGKVIEIGDYCKRLEEYLNGEVIIPLNGTLKKLKETGVEPGDVVAIRHKGKRKGKSGREYNDIAFSVYKREEVPF